MNRKKELKLLYKLMKPKMEIKNSQTDNRPLPASLWIVRLSLNLYFYEFIFLGNVPKKVKN